MNIDQAKGKNAGGPITHKRFVKLATAAAAPDGETCVQCSVAGEMAFGVSLFSVSGSEIVRGKGASVQTDGIAIVEASAALTVGQAVMTDANGRAAVATAGLYVLGTVVEPASALGNECAIQLGIAGAKA
jgi:hypothetical protein